MSKFKITWPTGLVHIAESEATTVDAYAMERWGSNSAADLAEYKVSLELMPNEAETFEGAAETRPVDEVKEEAEQAAQNAEMSAASDVQSHAEAGADAEGAAAPAPKPKTKKS